VVQVFLITLREGIEAALIIGIVLAYLSRTGRISERRAVWTGVVSALVACAGVGAAIHATVGSMDKNTERLFEGVSTLLAAALLSWMLVWMHRHASQLGAHLRDQVDQAMSSSRRRGLGLGMLCFVAVGREGLETVLFLFGFAGQGVSPTHLVLGATGGLGLAVVIGVLINRGSQVLDLQRFFRISGVTLIFFGAGLIAYGIHELQDAGAFPVVVKEVWNINHILNDKAGLGVFLKALLGYNGNPSLIEVGAYLGYLTTTLYLFLSPSSQAQSKAIAAR
jgi:high-affinity iron transporter